MSSQQGGGRGVPPKTILDDGGRGGSKKKLCRLFLPKAKKFRQKKFSKEKIAISSLKFLLTYHQNLLREYLLFRSFQMLSLDIIQDFLCELGMKPRMQLQEVIISSLYHMASSNLPKLLIKGLCKASSIPDSIYVLALQRSLIISVGLTMTWYTIYIVKK